MKVKKLNHVGVAAVDADKSAEFFAKYLGGQVLNRDLIPDQQMISEQVRIGDGVLELMETTEPDGVIGAFIAKKGAGMHHISFGVSGLVELVETLEADGVRIINKQLDGPSKFCFIHPRSTGGILIELSEEPEDNN